MSVDNRYESIMSDLIILMQEGLYRYITNQKVDLGKFMYYFKFFTTRMQKLEEQFVQRRIKFTKNLSKLQSLFKIDVQSQVSYSTLKSYKSKSHKKPQSVHELAVEDRDKYFHTLNTIGEQEQNQRHGKRKRVGTAGKNRNNVDDLQIQDGKSRPFTGTHRRVCKLTEKLIKQNKTEQKNDSQNNHTISKQRKSFYNELAKNHTSSQICQEKIKLPAKKKSISQYRWSLKINKLL